MLHAGLTGPQIATPPAYRRAEVVTMVKAERLGDDGVVDRWRVTGVLANGSKVDAVLETELDGRDAWWDEDTSPCETGGVDPGFDETGWEEVLQAVNEESEKHPEIFDR